LTRQTRQIIRKRRCALLQEPARDPRIKLDRARHQTALLKQICAELRLQPIDLGRLDGTAAGQHAEHLQMVQKRTQPPRRDPARVTLTSTIGQEPFGHPRRQPIHVDPLGLHPPTQMGKQLQMELHRSERIAPLDKVHVKAAGGTPPTDR
jgi:hypothetical protein